jgi:hypothetical protein
VPPTISIGAVSSPSPAPLERGPGGIGANLSLGAAGQRGGHGAPVFVVGVDCRRGAAEALVPY